MSNRCFAQVPHNSHEFLLLSGTKPLPTRDTSESEGSTKQPWECKSLQMDSSVFSFKLNPNVNQIPERKWQREMVWSCYRMCLAALAPRNGRSTTLKFQAICIPSSSFSVVSSSIGKILLQGHVGIPPLLCVFTLKLYTTLHLNERQTSLDI